MEKRNAGVGGEEEGGGRWGGGRGLVDRRKEGAGGEDEGGDRWRGGRRGSVRRRMEEWVERKEVRSNCFSDCEEAATTHSMLFYLWRPYSL